MKRKDGWEIRLDDFLKKRKTAPFIWGVNDCCLFSADGVQILNDNDPASWFRKKYSTKLQAFKILREFVGRHPEQDPGKGPLIIRVASILAIQHGFSKISPMFGKRGDVCALETGRGVGLGVIDLTGAAIVTPGDRGLVSFPLASAICAWSV